MNFEAVLFERRGRTALITLNRPHAMNAINAQIWREMGEALEAVAQDPDLWVAVITGAGDRSFCAGADLKEVAAGRSIVPEGDHWGFAGIVQHYINKPIIAAVNGFALGGGTEIALACDLVVASERASFGLPEVKRGIIAGAGGLLRLPRQIPLKVAVEAIFTGEALTAEEALRWGLVNRVVPHEEVVSKALELAEKICENAPVAVRISKDIIYKGLDVPLDHPQEAWAVNASYMEALMNSEDAKEGPRAFAEKRKPNWTGR
ncbi:crotonase/enoyl-CoA hydratase family protein [Paenibacillus sp.]|uniref:crotonase/enoyl-CoA hydratase family protein n=1 Tax=Paenibacillus sp. TaxID=58172 RepID=UPI002D683643|nr:crotonase/enoyl-CoA hydratase family protein [Paenibacillus sp.]HZG83754.1 crotonase/enoyl-CoA hydratase family protein [Paenibacillus sp.]